MNIYEYFKNFFSFVNLSADLFYIKYITSAVDQIFHKCTIIDRSNDWSSLLLKETYHIHGCHPQLHACQPCNFTLNTIYISYYVKYNLYL